MNKKDLIRQQQSVATEIRELNVRYDLLDQTIAHCTDERDKEYMRAHWQKLLSIYRKYRPKLFERIIVFCFELYTFKCKYGCSSGKRAIRLSDLLDKWDNGFCWRGLPVIAVTHVPLHFSQPAGVTIVCMDTDGTLKTVCPENGSTYIDFVSQLPKCPAWSERSVSDLKTRMK